MRCLRLWLLCLLCGQSLHVAWADNNESFLAARDAYRAGNVTRFEREAQLLQHSILQPYIEYWQINLHMAQENDTDILDFIARQADSPLSSKLRIDWLRQLAQRQDWPAFVRMYPQVGGADTSLQCDAWQAQIASATLAIPPVETLALWHSGRALPDSCVPVFAFFFSNHSMVKEDAWLRARHALIINDTTSAQNAFIWLTGRVTFNPKQLDKASRNADAFLAAPHDMSQRGEQELVRYAIDRIAQRDAQAAATQWLGWQSHYELLGRQQVWAHIAVHAGKQHLPQALDWFALTDTVVLGDEGLAWEARSALLVGNWDVVQRSITAMSDTAKAQTVWRYWLARSERMQGHVRAANMLLLPLSSQYDFYGLLAQEDLGDVISNPIINFTVSGDEVNAVAQQAGIQRALLLHELDLHNEAQAEWRWALRSFDDRQLLAAAELARQHRWLDCAINTADRTRELHNFELSFLAPYHDVAHLYAQQYGMDEAWIYGLMRQESRFISRAHSGAGASGLMQIMPATAHWIAHKLGINHFNNIQLSEPDTSLHFGIFYLKSVLQKLDNSDLLATAAYNAGPNRALRWRTQQPVEGAIYAETIPFSETRDYVKKVFANTVFYARNFNQPSTSLKARLGVVSSTEVANCVANAAGTGCTNLP